MFSFNTVYCVLDILFRKKTCIHIFVILVRHVVVGGLQYCILCHVDTLYLENIKYYLIYVQPSYLLNTIRPFSWFILCQSIVYSMYSIVYCVTYETSISKIIIKSSTLYLHFYLFQSIFPAQHSAGGAAGVQGRGHVRDHLRGPQAVLRLPIRRLPQVTIYLDI